MKTTPGPWEVFEPHKADRHPGVEASDGVSIVIFGDEEDDSGVQGSTPEEALANAYMIAAAPDLYAALKRALPWIREGLEFQSSEPQARADLAAAESALAKAEGPTTPEVSDER